MAEELRDKAISGAKWRVITTYVVQALQAAGSIVLAWLLDERDYGLVAAVMVLITLIRGFSNLGMNYAIIQRRDRLQEAVSTAFVMLLALSALSYGALLAVAPYTRSYASGRSLIMVLGLLFFLRPLAMVGEGSLKRDFHFRSLFVVDSASVVASTALAIVLAVLLPKDQRYWALALSGLVREAARSLVCWYCTPVRPKLAFDWAVARELFHYGKYFAGGAIVMALYGNVERLALSELISLDALGLYVFAYRYVFQVGDVSETIFGSVSMSVYAKLQGDVPRLRESFRRIVRLSALLSTGLLTGLVLLAPLGVRLFFPARWWPSVPIFQVLGLYYVVRAVDTATGQLYAAVGKPQYNMHLGIVNLAVMGALVVPFVLWWGPLGAAWCVAAARLATFVCNALVCRRVLRCPLATLVRIVAPAAKVCVVMAVVLEAGLMGAARVRGEAGWVDLGLLVALGSASYAAALYLFERGLFREVLGLARDAVLGSKAKLHGEKA